MRTVSLLRLRHVELTQSEVTQRNVSCVVEEDVLWFQITICASAVVCDRADNAGVPVYHIEAVKML